MKKIYIAFFCLILSANASAQLLPNLGGQRAGTSALTFLKFNASPRQVAMGGAQIAMAGDGYSTNSNPAAIVDVKDLTFALSNNIYVDGIQNNYLSAILPGKKYSSWGF